MARPIRTLSVSCAGIAAGLALLSAPAAMAEEEKSKGEKELEKILEGRVAGEPTRCIRDFNNRRFRVIDGTAYVYGSGNTIYVQRTRHPDRIDDDDILVTRKFGSSQVCRLDVMNTIDRFNGFFTGAVFFEDFVPYTRVKDVEQSDS